MITSFRVLKLISCILTLPFVVRETKACSGYKITVGNKTLVGSNADAWRLTPYIWFEKAMDSSSFGAAFTGSRLDGENGYAPQSGMNEAGLTFERLSTYTPENSTYDPKGKKPITNPTVYLKDILHKCKTVADVQHYIAQFDQSFFTEDVFLYVDRSGKYLVVEPFTMVLGDDASYVISNFCPSVTSAKDAYRLTRYKNGVAFLKQPIDTSLSFCKSLSDTMHVCRGKIGDGTLLTSIWDLSNGTVNLYFYHDYDNTVQFHLDEELKKEDHMVFIPSLFPPNHEFEQLRNYKIPQNSIGITLFLLASGLLFLFTSLYFLIFFFKRRRGSRYTAIQLLLFPLGLLLCYYLFILCTNMNIFYFSAPYRDPHSVMISISSFIPFLLIPCLVVFTIVNYTLFRKGLWSLFSRLLLAFNTVIYLVLIILFMYWGFYDVL